MTLREALARPAVEDIVLSARGLATFEHGSWQGPVSGPDTEPAAIQALARHIAEQASVTLGLTQPSVDAYLRLEQATFRAHVVIPPLAMLGPEITLRRLPELNRFSLDDFRMTPDDRARLTRAMRQGRSILVAGATGSGKTSLLTALLKLIPAHERVLILEDSPELPVPNDLSSKLLARVDRFGFRSGATWELSHLVFESLRMRPDRLILGECRGPEAVAIETALMTGHAGILTSIHAGSARQALERFRQLAARAPGELGDPARPLWDFAVHVRGEDDGSRTLTEVFEATGGHR